MDHGISPEYISLPLGNGETDDVDAEQLLTREIRATEMALTSSTRQTFKEPLSIEDQKFIEWLGDRYEGRLGTPIMTFACDGYLTLVVPTDLQRKRNGA